LQPLLDGCQRNRDNWEKLAKSMDKAQVDEREQETVKPHS
jgi:hypothetical protein